MAFIFAYTSAEATGQGGALAMFRAYDKVVDIAVVWSLFDNDQYPPIFEWTNYLQADTNQELKPKKYVRHIRKDILFSGIVTRYTYELHREDAPIRFFEQDRVIRTPVTNAYMFPTLANETFGFVYVLWDSEDKVSRPNPKQLLLPDPDESNNTPLATRYINSRFDILNDFTLNRFSNGASTGNPSYTAVTDKPSNRSVCLGDSEFLSYLSGPTVMVTTYDKTGNIIDRGFVAMGINVPFVSNVRFGCGPENINNIPSGWWSPFAPLPFTGEPVIDQNVDYYTIQSGLIDVGNWDLSPLVKKGEIYRFKVKKQCCPRRYRLHFINKYGVDDVITFEDAEILEYNTVDEFFERNLPLTFSKKDRQRVQLIKEADKVTTLFKSNLTKEEVLWIRQLLLSPNVFMELPNARLLAVYVTSGTNTIFDNEDGQKEIEITMIQSVKDQSQRN